MQIKKQEGDLLRDYTIEDYYLTEQLRPESQEGGLFVYVREDMNVMTELCEGMGDIEDQWMDSERQWIILKTGTESIAICSISLRCLQHNKPELYLNNRKIMDKIAEES